MESEELRRPYDLGAYTQLNSGDEGYIPRSEVKVLVDHPDFGGLPKVITLDNFAIGASSLIETGRYAPVSRIVNRGFSGTFSSIPREQEIKVYRMLEIESGVWVKQQVQFYYPSATPVTVNGFSLIISDDEDLTGVIIEYKFS